MYRKPKLREATGLLNLDSLMDILSCLVGVMLFLVIYTVLELGSTAYQVEMPLVRDPPPGAEPVLVLATNGTVRVLHTDEPLRTLLSGFATVPPEETLDFIEERNRAAPIDPYFRYSLEYRDRFSALGSVSGAVDLRVDELPGITGDSVQQLDVASRFATALSRLSPSRVWLEFAVDGASLEVFREARSMAGDRGFATEWSPWTAEFPLIYAISGSGVRALRPRGTPFKPQR